MDMIVAADVREAIAETQLKAGDIAGALQILRDRLRDSPGDQRARIFLFQALCIEGAWEKARAQLKVLAQLSPKAQMLAVAYNQAIDGEIARAAAVRGIDAAPLLHASPGWAIELANAFAADPRGASEMRARAFESSCDTPGDVDGQKFEYLFDGDERFGPTFEAIIAGRWGLLPFCAVEEMRTEGPVDLRDMVWLPVEIRLREGPSVAALLPVRYPGSEIDEDRELRLGRRTDWREGAGLRGLGQRVWTTSGGKDIGILSFRKIRFVALP
jgi:type VI secretion system protein ImpE